MGGGEERWVVGGGEGGEGGDGGGGHVGVREGEVGAEGGEEERVEKVRWERERAEASAERISVATMRVSAGEQMEDCVRYGGEEASAAGKSRGQATTEKSGFSIVFTRREKRRKKRAI
jgi:hypothetical protein